MTKLLDFVTDLNKKETIQTASPFINLSEYLNVLLSLRLTSTVLQSSSDDNFFSRGCFLFVLYNPFTMDIPQLVALLETITM